MGAARWFPFRSRAERAGAAAALLALLAGCVRPLPPPASPPPAAPASAAPAARGIPELEAEIRSLRAELGRLTAENKELRLVIERLKALDLDLELKRRQTR